MTRMSFFARLDRESREQPAGPETVFGAGPVFETESRWTCSCRLAATAAELTHTAIVPI